LPELASNTPKSSPKLRFRNNFYAKLFSFAQLGRAHFVAGHKVIGISGNRAYIFAALIPVDIWFVII